MNMLKDAFSEVEFVPCDGGVEQLRDQRRRGDPAIRAAIDVTIDAYLATKKTIGADATEVDLRDELEYRMRRLGADDVASSIVAFDARAALLTPFNAPCEGRRFVDDPYRLGAKGLLRRRPDALVPYGKGLDPSSESRAFRAKFDNYST